MTLVKLIPVLIGLIIGSGATLGIAKLVKPNVKCPELPKIEIPSCPPCNCPPSTKVDLGSFDVSKLNNRKGTFHYSPHLENVQVIIDCPDSVMLKKLLER